MKLIFKFDTTDNFFYFRLIFLVVADSQIPERNIAVFHARYFVQTYRIIAAQSMVAPLVVTSTASSDSQRVERR